MDKSVDYIRDLLGNGAINVFGRPFAGKDTQCKALANLLGGSVISSGDILRHDHGNTEIQRIMAEGGIIPSDLFESVVVPFLSREEFAHKPMILSEVGRVEGEQYVIMRATQQSGHPQKAVVVLEISDEEVYRRFDASIEEGDRGERADDRREVLKHRLDSYQAMVRPVIEFYREKGLLLEVDGSLERPIVTDSIIAGLGDFIGK